MLKYDEPYNSNAINIITTMIICVFIVFMFMVFLIRSQVNNSGG